MRLVFAALAGGMFGAGLLVSGMVDTLKVQGWLDVFGAWDPTLAFVMGGAILPMAFAWRLAARRPRSWLGTAFPAPSSPEIGRELVAGSVLFGMGWALAGLCPGPALASLTFGGSGGLIFLFAMLLGMVITPALRRQLFSGTNFSGTNLGPDPDRTAQPNTGPRSRAISGPSSGTTRMDIRPLTSRYAVSPQIELADLAAIKAAGFTTVIDNRPDAEIPPALHATPMRATAEALGLTFINNPVISGGLTEANIAAQSAAAAASTGPVFAYCASGNRSSVVWALMNAAKLDADTLINTAARYGYTLEHLRGQLADRAAKS